MTKTKQKIAMCVCLALALLLILSTAVGVGISANASSSGEMFDYSASSANLKYKTAQSDADDPGRKGLLLYGYNGGAFAQFKANLNGTFSADVKVLKHGNGADLSKYSLVFTDTKTNKSFSVIVENKGSYNNVCVSVDGNKAGIYYYTDAYNVNGSALGYTALYNNSETYTSVASNEIQLEFDPSTMQVNVLGNGGAYHPVWNFSEEYNDGKQLKHDLPQFGEYTVKVVFDEVKANGKGELLVYSFGGYTFESESIDSSISLFANVTSNAIVGKEYSVPQAQAVDLINGAIAAEKLSVSVYDISGNVLNNGGYKFTPDAEGEYFIYYSYKTAQDAKPLAVAFYRITALNEADCTSEFSYDSSEIDGIGKVGVHTTVYVPKATVASNMFVSGSASATVTVKKDGEAVVGYENVSGGFEFTFAEVGTYSFVYQVKINGQVLTEEKTVTVDGGTKTFEIEEVPQEVTYLSTINLTAGKVYFNGESHEMSVSLQYPSGKTVDKEGEYLLDELGTYIISNGYGNDVKTQEFTVRQTYSDLFEGDFTSTNYGTLVGNNTVNGQIVTLTNGNAVTFSKIIDLSDNSFNENLEDKSQNTPLLELYAQPHSLNVWDFQTLYITLTDYYDSGNYIIIRVNYLSYLPNYMRIRTMAAGQGWVGYDYEFYSGTISVDSAAGHDDGGTIVGFNCPQSADGRDFSERKLRLYFDNASGRLYTKTWQETTHHQDKATEGEDTLIPWLIRDYKTTDPTLSAGDTPWKGFTTGEVILSVYATGISDTADLVFTNIDGEDLTQKYYIDNVAPVITVDVDENAVPFAKVGKEFSVFSYVAKDAYSRVVEQSVKVLYNGDEIELDNGAFTPKSVGDYLIVYTATDTFGNVATKIITVEAKNSLPKLNITLDGTIPDELSFGELVQLPNATADGGAGGITINVEVIALEANKSVEIINNTFRALYAGPYQIKYTATDYIGSTPKSVYFYPEVNVSAAPIFDETSIVLPGAFISGETYEFSEYFATYYKGNGGSEQIKAVITVTDANGTNELTSGKYVPLASETVNTAEITFSFTANGQTTSVVKNVPILTVKRGVGYLKNFFATDGTVDATNDALIFAPGGTETVNVAFAKAISQRYLTVGMKRTDENPFSEMNVILRDISNPDVTVKLTYRVKGSNLTFSINDGVEYKANFDTNGNLAIKYDNASKRIYDVLGMEIGKITHCQDGSEFNGFPSGMAYMEIQADGQFALTSIANQNFNSFIRDAITPLLTVDGSFSGTYVPGQTVTLPAATAYDVLSSTGEITVTVKSSSGQVLVSGTASEELTFTPQSYGTYSVMYSVADSSGNKTNYTSSIVVVDNVKPTLTFDGEIAQTAKVGTKLKLPSYTVSDNGDISKAVVKTYVCGPDGILVNVTGDSTYKLDKKGNYTIYYFVVDDNNNTANYTFKITVS